MLLTKSNHVEFKQPGEQSFSGAVRQNLKAIEEQLEFGIRYEAIHKQFVAAGFTVGVNTFRLALYRARLKRDGLKKRRLAKAGAVKPPSAPAAVVSEPTIAKAAAPALAQDYFARPSIFNKPKG